MDYIDFWFESPYLIYCRDIPISNPTLYHWANSPLLIEYTEDDFQRENSSNLAKCANIDNLSRVNCVANMEIEISRCTFILLILVFFSKEITAPIEVGFRIK